MCYSYRTSIISYALGMMAACFAFYSKQYIGGMLVLFYCQIQLSEAIIWKGIDDNNLSLNKFGTDLGKYTIPSHVFAVGLGILVYAISKNNVHFHDWIPLIIGILFYICIVAYYPNMSEYTFPLNQNRSCQNNSNRLQWPYKPEKWYPYASILICIFLYMYHENKWIFGLSITYIISFLFYNSTTSVGTFWCLASALLAPLIVIYR